MDASLVISRSESPSIVTKAKTGNGVLMSAQGEDFFAGSGVPDFNCLIFAGRCHPVFERAEDQLDDRLRMSLQGQYSISVSNVPNLHFVVLMD